MYETISEHYSITVGRQHRVGTRNRGSRFTDNKEVDIVEEFCYLGSMLSKT
jgi:hypothetical protein